MLFTTDPELCVEDTTVNGVHLFSFFLQKSTLLIELLHTSGLCSGHTVKGPLCMTCVKPHTDLWSRIVVL